MSDRFKFRVWYTPIYSCEDDEKPHYVYDVEQIYDGYVDKGLSELGWVSSFGSLLDNDEYIVEQCTGLKDKNGKLIYEGDVVQMSYPYSPQNKYIVKWGDCCWELWLKNGFVYVIYEKMSQSMEAIGNIHENADLLENEE